jgi:hypothetical protein
VSAKLGEDVVNYIFRQHELRRRLIRMNALTMLHGISYLKTTWNGAEGTVDFQVASRADVFLDPLADTWKDLAYIIHKTTVPASTMRKRIESGIYTLPDNTPADTFLNRILTMPSTWGVNPGTRNSPDGGLGRPRRRAVLSEADEVAKHDRVGVVYELFDFIGNKYWHITGGGDCLFVGDAPYTLLKNPFIPLSYNEPVEGIIGVADADLIEPMVDQIHYMETLQLRHTEATIPVNLMNEMAVEDPDLVTDAIANATNPGDLIKVKMSSTGQFTSLADIFYSTPQPQLTPQFQRVVERLEQQVTEVLGIAPFQRGQVGQGTIATEFALADESVRVRQGDRLAEVGTVIEQAARNTLDLLNQFLDARKVIPIEVAQRPVAVTRQVLPLIDKISSRGSLVVEIIPFSPAETTRTAQHTKLLTLLPLLAQLAPEGLNVDEVAKLLVDTASLPPRVLWTKDEQLNRQQVAAQAGAEFDKQAAAQTGAVPPGDPNPSAAPPVSAQPGGGGGSTVPRGQVTQGGESAARQGTAYPVKRGNMSGGAGR